MILFRRVLAALLITLGCWSLLVSWHRFQLPYSEEGQYFDETSMVVYHQQSASVFFAAGIILWLGGIFLFLLKRKS